MKRLTLNLNLYTFSISVKIKPKNPIGIPKRPSSEDLQVFFLQEIEHGEKLLLAGDLEGCVEHFVNAIVVCSEPGKLLAILKQTLPRPIYLMVKLEIRLLSV